MKSALASLQDLLHNCYPPTNFHFFGLSLQLQRLMGNIMIVAEGLMKTDIQTQQREAEPVCGSALTPHFSRSH